ncbi:tRNA (adenosine(37)-N6)-dimethylallyltransferase MiaA [Hyphobacterium sp. CCMP332]|nr:tRNA (adenosine(37)-N6)-dimethylallyltransferase MiaA [Hyphobacterium sp. CCMP332]
MVIQGPTAVGKTSIAINLARQLNTDIINADSRQVYREMKIGTAPPTKEEQKAVKHHLLAHKSILDKYNAEMFAAEARAVLNELFQKNSTLILCGGSGFYVQALLQTMDEIPDIPEKLRNQVNEEVKKNGLSNMLNELKEKDLEYYSYVDKNNPQRVIRAIEVIRHTGLAFSSFHSNNASQLPYNILNFAITREREHLYSRINQRVDKMIEAGLEEEAKRLKDQKELNALQTVGYSEFYEYLDGKIDRGNCIELIKRNTRRFAKRQLTWLRRFDDLIWINVDKEKDAIKIILNQINGLA